jgi:hypothetical protein
MHIFLFLVLEMRVLGAHLAFCSKGRCPGSSASRIDLKARRAPNEHVFFHLALTSTVEKFISPSSPIIIF